MLPLGKDKVDEFYRDETIHTNFCINNFYKFMESEQEKLYELMRQSLDLTNKKIIEEAIEIEDSFIDDIIGTNDEANDLKIYNRNIADNLLNEIFKPL